MTKPPIKLDQTFSPTAAPTASPKRKWSPHQEAIFLALRESMDSLLINASPGSGKTTTIVEAIERHREPAYFFAFNNAIAAELDARLPTHASAWTFQSYFLYVLGAALPRTRIHARKVADLFIATGIPRDESRDLIKLVSLSKKFGVGILPSAPRSPIWPISSPSTQGQRKSKSFATCWPRRTPTVNLWTSTTYFTCPFCSACHFQLSP